MGLRQDAFGDPPTPMQFAAEVWRIATEPIMKPGFVQMRADIRPGVRVYVDDDYPGDLRAELPLPLTRPGRLRPVVDDLLDEAVDDAGFRGLKDWDRGNNYLLLGRRVR